MTTPENLYFAVGEIACAMTITDYSILKDKKLRLHSLLVEEFTKYNTDISVPDIVSQILNKDTIDPRIAYDWSVKQVKLNSEHVNEDLKQHFSRILQKVQKEFPPMDLKEHWIALHFINEMKTIKNDPAPIE